MKKFYLILILIGCSVTPLFSQTFDYSSFKNGYKIERTYTAGTEPFIEFVFTDTLGNYNIVNNYNTNTYFFSDSLIQKSIEVSKDSKKISTYFYIKNSLFLVSSELFYNDILNSHLSEFHRFDSVENKEYITGLRNDSIEYQIVNTYDSDHCLIKKVHYLFEPNKLSWYEYFTSIANIKNLKSSTSFIYDEHSNLIQTIDYKYDNEGIQEKIQSFFDKNQNIYRVLYFDFDDFLNSKSELKYDKHNNLTKKVTTFYNSDTTYCITEIYKYKYNENGKWIFRQKFQDKQLIFNEKRTFL